MTHIWDVHSEILRVFTLLNVYYMSVFISHLFNATQNMIQMLMESVIDLESILAKIVDV